MYRLNVPGRTALAIAATIVTSVALSTAEARAQSAAPRVEFARILPADTLVYFHVPKAAEIRAEWWSTALGRMVDDPQFRPLVDQAFAAVETAFTPARDLLGLSLQEWLTLPKGELGFAVLPVEGREPAVVLYLEAADDDPTINVLVDRGRKAALEAGMIEETESVGDLTLTIFRAGAGNAREVIYVRRNQTLIASTRREALRKMLELERSEVVDDTLAGYQPFVTLDRQIGRAEGEPAQLLFYIDPINLFRQLNRSTGAQVAVAMLPALGLDGLKGIGLGMTFNRGPFELIAQAQLLIDVPRSGVVELIALQPTTTEPEPWVPGKLQSYITFAWDVERTYHTLREVIDSFQGEGTFRRGFRDTMKTDTGVDFEEDILRGLTGRVSLVTTIEEPLNEQSRAQLLGVEIKDRAKAEEIIEKIIKKAVGDDAPEKKAFGGYTYYEFPSRADRQRRRAAQATDTPKPPPQPDAPVDDRPEPPRGVICVIDGYVLIADRAAVLEKALAALDDSSQRLSGSLDYKLIAAKAKRYAGENGPGLLLFTRPEEDIRFLYGLAANQRLRDRLGRGGENNPLLNGLHAALTDRPLPPLEVLQRYYAPAGAILVDEPTGLRYMSFVLRRDGVK